MDSLLRGTLIDFPNIELNIQVVVARLDTSKHKNGGGNRSQNKTYTPCPQARKLKPIKEEDVFKLK